MFSSNRSLLRLLALLPLILVVSGCSLGDGGDGANPSADLTADELLTRASERLAETQSLRFTLSVEGETFIDDAGAIRLREARGLLVRPDRVQTDFKITVLNGVTVTTSLIIIGSERWSTDLISGEWGPAPEEFAYDPTILFDNQGGIGPVMDRVAGAERLEDDEVRGRAAFVVRATVDASVIGPLTFFTMRGSPVEVQLWIDAENDNLLRARLIEPPDQGREAATWTLDLSGHGSDIEIEPPA